MALNFGMNAKMIGKFMNFRLTRHHDVILTRPTGAVLILRTATDCPERSKILDFVEVSALIAVAADVVVISVDVCERTLV